jgi:1,4-dihydroxy-2-naphthoate octaprenyltransferase
MPDIRTLVRLSSPQQLLLAAFTYSLGVGISKYLGRQVHLAASGLGLLAILAIQVAAFWLVEYFRLPRTPLPKDKTPRNREILRSGLLQSALVLFTGAGAIILTLFIARLLSSPAWIFISLIVIGYIAFSIPPLHLYETGYGELVQAIVLGTLIPALAFFIQNGEYHRLLAFATFPLTLLALAYFLVCDFPSYATDLKYGRRSMLIRLTWQRAIFDFSSLFIFFSRTVGGISLGLGLACLPCVAIFHNPGNMAQPYC